MLPVCLLPAGDYPLGDAALPFSRPAHTVTLQAFAIAETAVTNAQFAPFIEAGGYQQAVWWTAAGWKWQSGKGEIAPAFWDDPQFNHALQPVVGVSWYEAAAFTRWLAVQTGVGWRLPTEAEWEAAARGTSATLALPAPRTINSADLGIGRTWAALGSGQVAASGARDMLGNVWEWTASRWGRNWQTLDYVYPYDPADGREDLDGSHARVMRGGSWFDPHREAHPAVRGRYLPGSRGSNIGFRLAKNSSADAAPSSGASEQLHCS